jgi:hypothetical protein
MAKSAAKATTPILTLASIQMLLPPHGTMTRAGHAIK